jgi:hypothetical protein
VLASSEFCNRQPGKRRLHGRIDSVKDVTSPTLREAFAFLATAADLIVEAGFGGDYSIDRLSTGLIASASRRVNDSVSLSVILASPGGVGVAGLRIALQGWNLGQLAWQFPRPNWSNTRASAI